MGGGRFVKDTELALAGHEDKGKSCRILIKGLVGQEHQTQQVLQELGHLSLGFNESQVLPRERH